jgi:class 3 adenylate cyclase
MALFAHRVIQLSSTIQLNSKRMLQFRVGIHCGSVIAGVIGHRRPVFDLWGDNVNIASRMESNGESGRIHVSENVCRFLSKHYSQKWNFSDVREVEAKGKGTLRTYFISLRES